MRLSERGLEALDAEHERTGLSRSEIQRRALVHWLTKRTPEQRDAFGVATAASDEDQKALGRAYKMAERLIGGVCGADQASDAVVSEVRPQVGADDADPLPERDGHRAPGADLSAVPGGQRGDGDVIETWDEIYRSAWDEQTGTWQLAQRSSHGRVRPAGVEESEHSA